MSKQELFPANKRSCEHFSKYFTDAGLKELSDFARNQQSIGARKELQKELQEQMARGESLKDVSDSFLGGGGAPFPVALLTLALFHGADDWIRSRGDEEDQHLRADHDWDRVDQRHELRGVEQEGGARHRASHQTLEGMRRITDTVTVVTQDP